MKIIAAAIVLFVLAFEADAQLTTNQPARLKWKVEWSEKKLSGTGGNTEDFAPEDICVGHESKQVWTYDGWKNEVKWTFVGRNLECDVYQFIFTRTDRSRSSLKTTMSREVKFDGKQIVVFDDDLHLIVMEHPSESELKAAQSAN